MVMVWSLLYAGAHRGSGRQARRHDPAAARRAIAVPCRRQAPDRQSRKSTASRSGPVSSTTRKPATRLSPTPMCTVPSKSPASA